MTNARRPGSPTAHPPRLVRRLAWLPLLALALAAQAVFLVQDAPPAEASHAMPTPTGLAATAEGSTSVALSWTKATTGATTPTAQTHELRYREHGSSDAYTTATITVASGPTNVTYQARSLTASTTYEFQVRAKAASHTDSAWSTAVTATTTATPLVENTGETAGAGSVGASRAGNNHQYLRQQFTTGSNAGGYTITSVDLFSASDVLSTSGLSAELWTDDGDGTLGSKVADLTVPTSLTDGAEVSLTAPANTTLTASTTYAIVIYKTTTGSNSGWATVGAVDQVSSDTGWTIADIADTGAKTTSSFTMDGSTAFTALPTTYGRRILKMTVHGTAAQTQSTNANLSALAVTTATESGGTFTALSPQLSFAAGTTTYTASVANSVTHAKLSATVADTGKATLAYRKGSTGNFTTFTSGMATPEIGLDVGANAITVRVTAEDGTTTKDYTVTITRASGAMPTITLSTTNATVAENAGAVTISVMLSTAPSSNLTVSFARGGASTATATSDYSGLASVTIASGATTGSTTVTIVDDSAVEAEETLVIDASATGYTGDSLTLTITDNDTPAAPTSPTVTAGNQKLEVGWTAPAGVITGYQVHYTTAAVADVANSVAATVSDHTAGWKVATRSATLTTASQEITGLTNGTLVRVRVRAVSAAGSGAWLFATGTPAMPTLPTITLTTSDSDRQLPEGNMDSTYTITATLSANAANAVTVNLARANTSTAALNSDFTLSATSITISSGTNSGTVTLTVKGDQVDEDDETIILNATATGHTGGSLTQTIVDDDTAGATLSANSRGVKVGETVDYTLRLNSQPTGNVIIAATSADTGKATVSPATRTFTSSTWNTPQAFTVTGKAAGTVNITHAVTTANTGGKYPTSLSIGSVAVTVSALPTVTLTTSDADGNLPEGNADSTVTITATLSANAGMDGVTVNLARDTNSTAALTSDFTLSGTSISIAQNSNTGTVTLTVKGDRVDESNETIVLNATASGHTGGSLTQTIVDDDDAGVTVSQSSRTVEVGETTTYTVKLDSDPGGTVVIKPTSTSTTQATVSPATLSFTGGATGTWGTAQTVTIRGRAVGTPDITHAVTTARATEGYPTSLTIDKVDVTVNASTKTYQITSAVTANEGANAVLTVTLGRNAPTGNLAFSVAYSYAGSTATSADTGTTPTTVTVNAGSNTATLTVPITDDELVEGTETFTATITTTASGWNPSASNANRATVTITDDDAANAKIAFHATNAAATAAHTASIGENGVAATALVSNAGQSSTSGVNLSSNSWAQGFTTGSAAGGYVLSSIGMQATPGTSISNLAGLRAELWSAAGAGGPGSKLADLTAPRSIAAGAAFTLTSPGAALSAGTTYYVVVYTVGGTTALSPSDTSSDSEDSGAAADWSIEDTQWQAPAGNPAGTWSEESDYAYSIRITVNAAKAADGRGLTVPVTISHLPQASTTFNIEVVATGAHQATRNTEFRIPASVTWAASDTDKTKHVTLAITDDQLVEFDETVSLRIAAADATPNDLGDHYTRHASGSTATLTIEDDEAPGAVVSFGSTGASATAYTASHAESVDPTVAVSVTALPQDSQTFVITVTGGTATEGAGDDYTIAAKSVTFGPTGSLSRNITIDVNDDAFVEDDQTITLSIAAADTPATALEDLYVRDARGSTATVTIEDDEAPNAKIAFGSSAQNTQKITRNPGEEDGTLTIPITITAAPEQDAVFSLTVAGTATEGTDFTVSPQTFTFTKAGGLTQNVSIAVTNDMLVEDDQTIELTLARSGTNFSSKYALDANGKLAEVTIDDDESETARIAFGSDPAATTAHTATVAETVTGGALNVPVTVNHLPEGETTFTIEVLSTGTTARETADPDNTAGNPSDYTIATKSVTFRPTDATETQNLVISINNDDVEENDETIALRIVAADAQRDDLGDHYTRHAQSRTSTVTLTSEDAVSAVTLTIDGLTAISDGHFVAAEGAELTLRATADIPVGPDGWRVVVSRHAQDLYTRFTMAYGVNCSNQGGQVGGVACPNDVTLPAAFTIMEGQTQATGKLVVRTDSRTENTPEELDLTADASRGGRSFNTGRLQMRLTENNKGANLSASAMELVPNEAATYTVSLRGAAPTADVTVTITSSDTDKATATASLTFTSTNYADPQTVTVTAAAVGTATISHAASSQDSSWNLGASALGTVAVKVVAAQQTYSIESTAVAAEGAGAELTVTLGAVAPTGGLAFAIDRTTRTHRDKITVQGVTGYSIDPATATVASDLASPPSTVTVAAGMRTVTITDPVADDDLVEGDERYYLEISTSVQGWSAATTGQNCVAAGVTGDAGCARVTITDPDAAGAQIAFGSAAGATTAHTASVSEGGGTLNVPVTISALPGAPAAFAVEVLATGSGRATENTDFSIATKSVTFGPSDTTTTKNLVVTITEDAASEGDETITLRLRPADTPATALEDLYQRHASGSTATLTITDNDGSVTVSQTGVTVRPGATVTYTVRLGAQPDSDVTITPTSDDTDVATVSGALTFTAGNWSQTQTVTVTGVAEGTAAISHAVGGSDPSYPSSLSVASVDVTVAATTTATLSVAPNPVREGATVTVTITLSDPVGEVKTLPIVLGDPSDTAESGDYGTLANIRISGSGTVFRGRIRTNQDADTKDETFTVALGDLTALSSLSAGSPSSVEVTITDDDPERALRLTVRPGNERLALSWTRPTGDITGYSVAYKTDDAPDTDATTPDDPTTGWVAHPHTGDGRTTTITGLTNGTAYNVRVAPQGTPDIGGDAATITRTATPRTGGGGPGPGPGPTGGGPTDDDDTEDEAQTVEFADVDADSVHTPGIQALHRAGITRGCNTRPLRYCPNAAVTRAQMATFLVRALKLQPPDNPPAFTDIDPDSTFRNDIAALHRAGITRGCNTRPLQYCPDQPVTRAQMATFLTRALKLETPEDPPAFTDIDPDSTFRNDIAALHAAGITTGCRTAPLRYCPDQPVTRAQMATFLTRALKLP